MDSEEVCGEWSEEEEDAFKVACARITPVLVPPYEAYAVVERTSYEEEAETSLSLCLETFTGIDPEAQAAWVAENRWLLVGHRVLVRGDWWLHCSPQDKNKLYECLIFTCAEPFNFSGRGSRKRNKYRIAFQLKLLSNELQSDETYYAAAMDLALFIRQHGLDHYANSSSSFSSEQTKRKYHQIEPHDTLHTFFMSPRAHAIHNQVDGQLLQQDQNGQQQKKPLSTLRPKDTLIFSQEVKYLIDAL